MKYVSPREYKNLTGTAMGLEEIKRAVRTGELPGYVTEGGQYKIKYEEMNSEEVDKLKAEITRLKTVIANMIAIGKEI